MLCIGIVLLHQIQNPTQSLRKSQDYTWSLISPISASHCCLILVRLKVLGLLDCGFGKDFCCCWFSPSFFWDLQKRTVGAPATFLFLLAGGLFFHLGFLLQRRLSSSYSSVLLFIFCDQIVLWK